MDSTYQIDYYVLKNHLKKAKKYYAQTHTIFEAFSGFFGEYPYPSDGAGFVESPYTGMEHQGAIAIGTVYGNTFRPGFIPDYDLLLVHETAHEWWGNAVAIEDMADAWISEGFATYAEMMFIEKMFGYKKYLDAVGFYAQSIVNAWPLVGDRDVNDNTFITNDIYFKGAAMLNNLRCILDNDSLFFSLIKGFFQEYKMKITDSYDFTSYAARYCEGNLDDFFDAFLYRDTPPILEYSFAMVGGSLLLTYRWTGVGKDFTMPFCIVINDKECIRLIGTTSAQRFSYNGAGSFYIPNPFNYNPDILDHNSFTYFQTHFISH
jgi:aminopeptidase N